MANVVVVLVIVLLAGSVMSVVRRRRRSLVPQRGTSIGADLGALLDQPRVRVLEVTIAGSDRVGVVLTPETGPDMDLVVSLREGEFGLELLQEWQRSASSLAIVIPPDSQLVRLRSIDNQQPLTLRRVER